MEVLSCSLSSTFFESGMRFQDWLMIRVSAFRLQASWCCCCRIWSCESSLDTHTHTTRIYSQTFVWKMASVFDYEKGSEISNKREKCLRTHSNANIGCEWEAQKEQKSLLNSISILFYSILIVSSDLCNMKALSMRANDKRNHFFRFQHMLFFCLSL